MSSSDFHEDIHSNCILKDHKLEKKSNFLLLMKTVKVGVASGQKIGLLEHNS